MLLWAPRHPERFRPVSQAAIDAGWRVATRRLTRWPDGDDAVFVVDTLGELMDFYACAQVAFVGGSLQDIGGHKMLEPAAVGRSEARCVGKECVSTGSTGWAPYHYKKNIRRSDLII